MFGSPSTIRELQDLLNSLRSEEVALRAEYEGKIQAKQREIEGVEKTVELLANRSLGTRTSHHVPATNGALPHSDVRQAGTAAPLSLDEWRPKLRHLTHFEALVCIAKENQGIVRVTEARRIFIEAKVSEGKPKNIPSQIHRLLAQSDKFEKVEPGVFRLIGWVTNGPEPARVNSDGEDEAESKEPRPYQNRFPVPVGPVLSERTLDRADQQEEE